MQHAGNRLSTSERAPSAQRDAETPPLPDHFRFSTREIPVEGKFETWRDLWLRLAGVDVSTQLPQSFEGDVEVWSAGALSIASTEAQVSCYSRSARLAGNSGNEFSLTLCRVNGVYAAGKAESVAVKKGGAFLVSHDRPFNITAPQYCRNQVLLIDRTALLALLPKNFDLASQSFDPDSRLLGLIRNMVPLVANRTEPMPQEKRTMIGQQVVDLVALLLNPSRDGRALIESRGLKAAHIGAILREIDRRFDDPSLSPEQVADALGISARHVHRLLEETTKTFYEHLVERRLQSAHERLTECALAGAKVADIAAQAGFTNVTHFNRLFRTRFGDTPTGVRSTVHQRGGPDVPPENARQ